MSDVKKAIGVDCHGFTPIVGRALGIILASFGSPKEAQIEPKSLLGLSGEAMFCLTWRLEASALALEAHSTRF